jgi:hypothetical protein
MANVFAIAFFVMGVVASHTCMTVWAAVMFPQVVERARRRLEGGPLICLACGAIFCLASGGVLLALMPFRFAGFSFVNESLEYLTVNVGLPRFDSDFQIITHGAGWLVLSPVMAGWIIGGASLARIFEARARQNLDVRTPARALIGGAFCATFACFLPFVGWFVFFPLVAPMCIGAGLLALVTGGGSSIAVPEPTARAKILETVEA